MENKEGTQEKNIDRILKRLEACQKARDWAAGKSIEGQPNFDTRYALRGNFIRETESDLPF